MGLRVPLPTACDNYDISKGRLCIYVILPLQGVVERTSSCCVLCIASGTRCTWDRRKVPYILEAVGQGLGSLRSMARPPAPDQLTPP